MAKRRKRKPDSGKAGSVKLDLGSGPTPRPGYQGVDLVEAPGVVQADIAKGLPFDDASVDAIWSSHFLEHLADVEVIPVLKECKRVLRPGGKLEICVPDLLYVCKLFVRSVEEERWGWPMMTLFGHQQGPGEFHRTGFSKERLFKVLMQAGLRPLQCWKVWAKAQESLLMVAER